MELKDYVKIFRRRWKEFIAVVVLTLAIYAGVQLKEDKLYGATSVVNYRYADPVRQENFWKLYLGKVKDYFRGNRVRQLALHMLQGAPDVTDKGQHLNAKGESRKLPGLEFIEDQDWLDIKNGKASPGIDAALRHYKSLKLEGDDKKLQDKVFLGKAEITWSHAEFSRLFSPLLYKDTNGQRPTGESHASERNALVKLLYNTGEDARLTTTFANQEEDKFAQKLYIKTVSKNPLLAVLWANALQDAGRLYHERSSMQGIKDRIEKIKKQIRETDLERQEKKEAIKAAKRGLQETVRRHNFTFPYEQLSAQIVATTNEIGKMNKQLQRLLEERQRRQLMVGEIQQRIDDFEDNTNGIVQALNKDIAVLKDELNELLEVYTEDHKLVKIKRKQIGLREKDLADSRAELQDQRDRKRAMEENIAEFDLQLLNKLDVKVIGMAEGVHLEGQGKIGAAKLKLEQLEKCRAEIEDLQFDMKDLENEYTSLTDEKKSLNNQKKEQEVAQANLSEKVFELSSDSYAMMNRNANLMALEKRTKGAWGFMVVFALVISIAVVYLIEYMDTKLRTEHDVRRHLNLPVLSVIPRQKAGNVLLSDLATKDPFAEIFNTTATLIRSSAQDLGLRTFLVSSTVPKEGKTTISVNLAVALARKGLRVILVDADLRIPSLHELFGIDNTVGLSSILEGRLKAKEILDDITGSEGAQEGVESFLQYTETDNLRVLPSGPTPADPINLLESLRMKALLEELKELCDFVILDTPPIFNVGDTLTLATQVDANIFVVGSGSVEQHQATWAKHLLTNVEANILGVVLNQAHETSKSYYYYYNDYKSYRTR